MIFLFLPLGSAAYVAFQYEVSVRDLLFFISEPLQLYCRSRFSGLDYASLGEALVCGVNLESGPWRRSFQQLNLYHVLVVSGAHLVVLASLIDVLEHHGGRQVPKPLKFGALVTFAFMTGLEAPLVRALFFMTLRASLRRPPAIDLMLSFLYCLVFEPRWIHSLSLQLSVMAGVGLRAGRTPLTQAVALALLIAPLLLPLGLPSLPGWGMGFLLSPLLELVLFPILATVALWPGLGPWLEEPLAQFMRFLVALAGVLPPGPRSEAFFSRNGAWIYTGTSLLLLYALEVWRRPSSQNGEA